MLLDDSQVANVEIYTTGMPSIPCFIIILFFKLAFFPLFKLLHERGVGSKIGIVQPVPRPHTGGPDPAVIVHQHLQGHMNPLVHGPRACKLNHLLGCIFPLYKAYFSAPRSKAPTLRYNLDSILAIPAPSTLLLL